VTNSFERTVRGFTGDARNPDGRTVRDRSGDHKVGNAVTNVTSAIVVIIIIIIMGFDFFWQLASKARNVLGSSN
jgi:hypothetical protein